MVFVFFFQVGRARDAYPRMAPIVDAFVNISFGVVFANEASF